MDPLHGIRGRTALFIVPKDIRGGLTFIKGLIEKEKFKSIIDRMYPLDRIAEAY
jgi:hypothetical protein